MSLFDSNTEDCQAVHTNQQADAQGGQERRHLRVASPPSHGSTRKTRRKCSRIPPVLDIVSMDEQLNKSLVTERLISALSTAFGFLAMFLACLGLYGVIA